MKKLIAISTAIVLVSAISCTKSGLVSTPGSNSSLTNNSHAGEPNGIHSAIPAYYDSSLFKIIFMEFSPQAEASHIAHDKSINFIYQSDPGLPNNQPFISVIDAIPGDGFNPVWREIQIVFNPGFTPRQLYSDNGVAAAAAGPNPEITLVPTNEVYWCPVVGPK